ncbi:hypothetical protein DCAR_0519176 [Daucus carota subsp. sativus]|uniref:Uncharacterized protein n=2 Tax=Daucus carota subsp. sativus TaxID=79200 RepID=A0A164XS57_DAUCS|nr:hypothetical protein DCAR_0519176 [Daucus carota subsp. sativus]
MTRVEIISKQNIKPSSPTPQHLKIFKLSLLDQLIPAPFVPMVMFYPNNYGVIDNKHHDVQERLVLLKQSLSHTLTRFYPLAGIVKNDLWIDCNDQGAYFAVAKVSCDLNQFLDDPNLLLINKFLPLSFTEQSSGGQVTNIQVNTFECGGMAIAVCISHKILDGAALSTFLTAWSGTARGLEKAVCPDFVASLLFPADDQLWLKDASMVMWGSLFKKGKCTTRRFVFDGSAIATLKKMTTDKNVVQNPTRVEAVSAFIWKCAMVASEKKGGAKNLSLLTHVVNLRRRMKPALSKESIGNLIWIASAKCYDKLGYGDLVEQVRNGISEINGEYVKQMMGDPGAAVMSKSMKEIGDFGSKEEVDHYACTSWCNFDFYEVDFGWGRPVWVSNVGLEGEVLMNFIVLMDTKCGGGIEAWLTLDEQEMDILEHDHHLLALASLDPSPLQIC